MAGIWAIWCLAGTSGAKDLLPESPLHSTGRALTQPSPSSLARSINLGKERDLQGFSDSPSSLHCSLRGTVLCPFGAESQASIFLDVTGSKPKASTFVRENNKMQIKLKCSCGEGSCHDWAIIELQGAVEVQPGFQDQLQNLEIGRLCHPSQGVYTFTVGYHELTGSKVPLKKPLLVLKKVKHSDADEGGKCGSSNTELEVIGIIRHRILFKTRPKALISRHQPAGKEKTPPTSVASSTT